MKVANENRQDGKPYLFVKLKKNIVSLCTLLAFLYLCSELYDYIDKYERFRTQ